MNDPQRRVAVGDDDDAITLEEDLSADWLVAARVPPPTEHDADDEPTWPPPDNGAA